MKKENILKGIIGGFIGSLAGVVAIVLFSKLGYVAAIAGLIMAVCTINLYQKFAGGISKKGIIACIIIMIIMTVVGNNLAFSFALAGELKEYYNVDSSVTYIFFNLFSLMSEGLIVTSTYVGDLMLIVIFNLIGAVGTFKNQIKNIKISNANNNANYNGNNQNNINQNNNNNNNSAFNQNNNNMM